MVGLLLVVRMVVLEHLLVAVVPLHAMALEVLRNTGLVPVLAPVVAITTQVVGTSP